MFQELKLYFNKKGKEKKGNFKKNGKQVATTMKNPKARPKPNNQCFYCKGNGHWKWNCPRQLADKKDDKVNKGVCDIHVIGVYLTSARSSPRYFDTCSVTKISNSKQELRNKQRLVEEDDVCWKWFQY